MTSNIGRLEAAARKGRYAFLWELQVESRARARHTRRREGELCRLYAQRRVAVAVACTAVVGLAIALAVWLSAV